MDVKYIWHCAIINYYLVAVRVEKNMNKRINSLRARALERLANKHRSYKKMAKQAIFWEKIDNHEQLQKHFRTLFLNMAHIFRHQDRSQPSSRIEQRSDGQKSSPVGVIAGVTASIATVLLLIIAVCFYRRRKSRYLC